MMHSRTQRLVALSMAVAAVGCARTQTTDMGVSDSGTASAAVTTTDSTVVATTTTTDTLVRDTTTTDTTTMRDTTSMRDTSITQRDTMTASASGDVSLGVGVASDAMVARLVTTVDSAEIEAARLLLSKTQNADLRTYAQQLIDDHTASLAVIDSVRPKLQTSDSAMTTTTMDSTTRDTAAAQTGVAGSQDLNTALATLQADHSRKMETLRAQSGTELDRTYITGQVEAHQNVLNLLRRFGTNVSDATLRSHVESYTGKVSQHLESARTLQRTIASE